MNIASVTMHAPLLLLMALWNRGLRHPVFWQAKCPSMKESRDPSVARQRTGARDV